MKYWFKAKDGGPESLVWGYWLFESKKYGSIVILRFDKGSREAYHTHAFNAVSWILKGALLECVKEDVISGNTSYHNLVASIRPIYTPRERLHRVFGLANKTWALSFRGPWVSRWKEYLPSEDREVTLTHGRVEIE